MKSRNIVIASLGLIGLLCSGVAAAREPDVRWSVTIGSPSHAPVYVRPYPVHAQPVYHSRHYRQPQYEQPTRWDRDGDGIPNRRDRLYNPAWDRDGDGVPNRYDRRNDRRHDRHDWGR